MIGDKNPNYDFLCTLFSKCSYNIFSSEHVQCILKNISKDKGGFKDSSGNLLLVIKVTFSCILTCILFLFYGKGVEGE
jgi:sister-chromatid-cohesion protein PDS5